VFFRRIPRHRCVTTNYFIELGLDENQRIGDVVANLVELLGWESVLTGSIKQVEPSRDFLENWTNIVRLLGDSTVNEKWEACWWKCGWCHWLASEFSVNVVNIADFFESSFNLTVYSLKLFFAERSFNNFLFFHENLRKYLIHVNAWNFIKLPLVDHRDEVVHLFRVSKAPGPYLELYMFVFYTFDHVGEKHFHFILHGAEFRNFGVGVFVEYVFDFGPSHLFTCFMEECAFFPIVQTMFTDEAGFSALGVHTDHETMIAINALWKCLEVFWGHDDIFLPLFLSINIITSITNRFNINV